MVNVEKLIKSLEGFILEVSEEQHDKFLKLMSKINIKYIFYSEWKPKFKTGELKTVIITAHDKSGGHMSIYNREYFENLGLKVLSYEDFKNHISRWKQDKGILSYNLNIKNMIIAQQDKKNVPKKLEINEDVLIDEIDL